MLPTIRPARADEAESLSALAFRSKSHWSYTPEQLEVFRAELTLSATQVAAKRAHVAEESGAIVGFYSLVVLDDERAELEHIFVDPRELGRGVGSRLFLHACETARASGASRLVIQSDPNAAGFYSALGATLEREIPSSIPGRTIPLFTHFLTCDVPMVKVRPGDGGDRSEWLRMRASLWPASRSDHEREIDELVSKAPTDAIVLVAEREGGGLGGFLEASTRPYAEGCYSSPVGYVEGWWVDPDLRRAGVGALLMAGAEAWARSLGLTEMASDTELENERSQAAHRALAYEESGRVVCFRKQL